MSFVPGAPPFLQTPNLDRMAKRGRAHPERVRDDGALLAQPRVDPHRPVRAPPRHRRQHHADPHAARRSFRSSCRRRAIAPPTSASGTWAKPTTGRSPGSITGSASAGQGIYVDPTLNINGQRRQVPGYTTDILTDQALEWLKQQTADGAEAAVLHGARAQGRALGVRAGAAAQGPVCQRADPLSRDDGRFRGQLPRQAALGQGAAQQLARRGFHVSRRDAVRCVLSRVRGNAARARRQRRPRARLRRRVRLERVHAGRLHVG